MKNMFEVKLLSAFGAASKYATQWSLIVLPATFPVLLAAGLSVGFSSYATQVYAQTQVAFAGLKHDSSLPIEIAADQLAIDQSDGAATFSGNVQIAQGDLRLTAGLVRVEYKTGDNATGEIARLLASSGVTFVNGTEAAEAKNAIYTIETGVIILTGDVILTQGNNALSSQKLTVDLNSGTAILDGRVKSIIQTGKN